MKKMLALLATLALLLTLTSCGSQPANGYKPVSGLDTKQNVTLTIAIPYETNKALNTVANAFMTQYPNVSVHLEYVEDYDINAVQMFKDNKLDMILQKNIVNDEYVLTDEATKAKTPTGTWPMDYFYNFAADTEIDFSHTSPDISGNYRNVYTDADGKEVEYIFSYPLGGETRGVFVNTTLLNAYGLAVPKNYPELLACCDTLKQNGLIPIQGNPASAAYSLGLASAVNPVVHNEAALAKMAAAEEGVGRLFEGIIGKVYTLAAKRYFDYKTVEEMGFFTSSSELGQARSFLGLKMDDATFELSTPENGYGNVAFMPYLSSMGTLISALIEENKLKTEFTFICSPMNDEGTNAPAYVTPYYGLCANKNSENLVWIREFVNFMFQPDINKAYAEEAGIIPNTTDAMAFAAEKYSLNAETDITLCGQILFSESYNGYTPVAAALLAPLKCNAQKYMVDLNLDANGSSQPQTDADGKACLLLGNGETLIDLKYVAEADTAKPGWAFCSLEYYLDGAEAEFAKFRVK